QKADLARQRGDWATIASLKTIAQAAGLGPLEPLEWLPFIEGAAQLEDWPAALSLTQTVGQDAPQNHEILCRTWARLRDETPDSAAQQAALSQVEAELECR
ncbi:MAG TPA: hypothetical protein VLS48_06490, partial [Anaerolineales bacterium]|nr:hypothetical protein [Anaerolineales bacterium]